MSVGIKGQVMVVVEKVYVVVVWPLLQPVFWAVAKLCFPKRLRDVLVGLMWPIFIYFYIDNGYYWHKSACGFTGWFLCSESPLVRPELTAWRHMYGDPICVLSALCVVSKFFRYVRVVERRLNRRKVVKVGAEGYSFSRRFWWL
ncbi:hypothetical protein [Chromobacterium sp. Rain0013]|uniref:hypothetical protein n=1 Tax=Chromobacterium sp. Rain0013 TaxID=2292447 RepID=UPI001888EDD2|nr:hypothetical protein [Chromobacterium sp. Rain0013]